MTLESTKPLTEMSTRNLPGDKGRPGCKADNLTAVYKPIVYKMWKSQHLKPYGPPPPLTGTALLLHFYLT
jgi:hypothetical protein